MKGTLTGAVIGLVSATVNLAVVFGVRISTAGRDAIIAEATAVTVIAPLVGAAFDHSKRQADARLTAAAQIASK